MSLCLPIDVNNRDLSDGSRSRGSSVSQTFRGAPWLDDLSHQEPKSLHSSDLQPVNSTTSSSAEFLKGTPATCAATASSE